MGKLDVQNSNGESSNRFYEKTALANQNENPIIKSESTRIESKEEKNEENQVNEININKMIGAPNDGEDQENDEMDLLEEDEEDQAIELKNGNKLKNKILEDKNKNKKKLKSKKKRQIIQKKFTGNAPILFSSVNGEQYMEEITLKLSEISDANFILYHAKKNKSKKLINSDFFYNDLHNFNYLFPNRTRVHVDLHSKSDSESKCFSFLYF